MASLLAPSITACVLAVLIAASHRRLPPKLAAHTLLVTLIVMLSAITPTMWLVSLGYLAHLPAGRLEWCAEALGIHEPIPAWMGVPALAASVIGATRARSVTRSYRRLRCDHHTAIQVTEHFRPFAFTLPGRGGRVVLSRGLVRLLDEDERAIVVAHERAHGVHRHDRYLLTARLADAILPGAKPLTRRLQFSLERWADEAAVAVCGDRRFVARTLGKVALHGAAPAGALGFGGLGVPARVAALLTPPTPPRAALIGSIWMAIAGTTFLSAFQLHHLGRLVTALCPG